MRKLLATAALSALLAGSAAADTWQIAIPAAYPGDTEALGQEIWSFSVETLAPGDDFVLLDARSAEQIARMTIPDEPRFENARFRLRQFAQENARIGAHLEVLADSGDMATIDVPRLLMQIGAQRLDPQAPSDVMVIGDPVYVSIDEPHFSMRDAAGAILVPSDAHIPASVSATPFGTAGRAGTLDGVAIHFCHVGDQLSTDADTALLRFWSLYVEALGGELVTWTGDLAACFDRFRAQARNTLADFTLETGGPMVMTRIARDEVSAVDDDTIIPGVVIEAFDLFASAPHPSLPHLLVTTGIEYEPANYPDRYSHAWCYFSVRRGGVLVKFDVGGQEYGEPVEWYTATRQSLAAAGISEDEFLAAQPACQWPESAGR